MLFPRILVLWETLTVSTRIWIWVAMSISSNSNLHSASVCVCVCIYIYIYIHTHTENHASFSLSYCDIPIIIIFKFLFTPLLNSETTFWLISSIITLHLHIGQHTKLQLQNLIKDIIGTFYPFGNITKISWKIFIPSWT